jgi:hypothetical protein
MNSNERYGLIKVVDQYGKYGFKDLNGETLIPCQYDEAWVRLSRHIEVELNGKHGFVDRVGKILTPIKYDSLGKILGIDSAVLHPWIYIGRVKNKCVFLDCRTGSELTPYYDRIWYG